LKSSLANGKSLNEWRHTVKRYLTEARATGVTRGSLATGQEEKGIMKIFG